MEYSTVEISSHEFERRCELLSLGYRFLERTIDVMISVKGYQSELKKRFMIEQDDIVNHGNEVLSICEEAFTEDYRFHKSEYLPDIEASMRMSRYIQELGSRDDGVAFFATYKSDIVAFLILTEETDSLRISLAAVKPRYQGTGLAKELYEAAIVYAIQNDCKKVIGRIASANSAVMNLYASFGAKFFNPVDVFVKPLDF